MRFDDRLATVLAQPVAASHDRNVRWRQLVDLVARSTATADRVLLDRAIATIEQDRSAIAEPLRAAAARSIAGAAIPVALLEVFAGDSLAVAAPLLAGGRLEGDALERVRRSASPDVRRFLDTLHPGAPKPAELPEMTLTQVAPDRERAEDSSPGAPAETSIGDVVARLDRLRSERDRDRARSVLPEPVRSDSADTRSVFRWECSPGGEIDWVEGVPRGPLIGRSIAVADPDEGVDDCVERAFSIRAPFRDCVLELGDEGQLAGRWTISGAPAFAANDGRFIGYRGIAQRGEPQEFAAPEPSTAPLPDSHDTLREMIHEIKTPLNAIIGFAEIIDGQYFGPAHRRYRERAAQIVSNARALLEAANDLDFVARIQSAGSTSGQRTDLKTFFPAFTGRILEKAAQHGVQVDIQSGDADGLCALEPTLTERLLARFSDAVLGATAPGEQLMMRVRRAGGQCGIAISRPRSTILATRDDLLDPEFTIGDSDRGLLGLGFSLRLVNGLVELAGGTLDINDQYLTLLLPLVERDQG
ncbi:HAMP domain-containing histidine kinase [Sphingomonas sp. HDW15A]|uniref:HAMP domain-containing histidine kinase n=1 Tax=Sphingomonas sp. HDW15A TaxID=2714942 RepID=UPI001407D4A6|nr:HAMP domain-containing histidine kinase [Sphingomonas sp. HDW15A]QIK96100.1 HAMP domain-containing histidine kinase [Sphingomonas sp. HDW15A]